jgi:hypothetical protein
MNTHKLIICFYYILTTLLTVGYGDLCPKSDIEKICGNIYLFYSIYKKLIKIYSMFHHGNRSGLFFLYYG